MESPSNDFYLYLFHLASNMKPGDMIQVDARTTPGALTAVKYFAALETRTGGRPGLIISDHGNTVLALFGENMVVVHKSFVRVVNEGI